jgi:hypothetical protein
VCYVFVEGKEQLLSLKLDILLKNIKWKKKMVVSTNDVGDGFFNKDSMNAKNKQIYVNKCLETILSLMQIYVHFGCKKKWFSLPSFSNF